MWGECEENVGRMWGECEENVGCLKVENAVYLSSLLKYV
jgi:hypothetical protein